MAKHEKDDESRESSSARGGVPRRGGFGDDQGTRVGAPTPSGRERAAPSTRPADEGLEGAILDERQEEGDGEQRVGPTSSGAESTRGMQGSGGGTGASSDRSGGRGGDAGSAEAEPSRAPDNAGSEPLRDRTHEHESGYGGAGGRPKRSGG